MSQLISHVSVGRSQTLQDRDPPLPSAADLEDRATPLEAGVDAMIK
jgi:hypothetical protein